MRKTINRYENYSELIKRGLNPVMSMRKCTLILILLLIFILGGSQLASAVKPVPMEFFYSNGCSDCEALEPIITSIEQEYGKNLSVQRYEVSNRDNWNRFANYGFIEVPAVVINYKTKLQKEQITKQELQRIIEWYLTNHTSNVSFVDRSPQNGVEGESYTFLVSNISDAVNISNVMVSWSHGTLRGNNVSMIQNQNNTWSLRTTLDLSLEDMKYTITLTNIVGTSIHGEQQIVSISPNPMILHTPWGVENLSAFSLPVITIVLGSIDSINPCSFWTLLFLLSLLIYAQSRRRMLLIGGIYVFFSFFIYFVFMVFLLEIFIITTKQILIGIIAGVIALILGSLNIKDFFFFKRGPSLSMSEEKQHKLFKRMRTLIKATHLPTMIIAAIVLSIFANSYQMFCTMGIPIIYTKILTFYHLQPLQYYLYLILYNIFQTLPLLIIVIIFTITLGSRKLTERQGRILKLFSGLMISLLGVILIIQPQLFLNMFVVLLIPLIALIVTTFFTFLIKPENKKQNVTKNP